MRAGFIALVAALLTVLAITYGGAGESASAALPNIVVVVTDDQTAAAFSEETMPRASELFDQRGTNFTNAIVTTPLCCPSRASMLTGQYAHNHGVLSNKLGYAALRGKPNVLPRWLQRAGYETIHVGKFLHAYERTRPRNRVAPGWDEWVTTLEKRAYYDYDLAVNGSVRHLGTRPRDHVSLVLGRTATRLTARYAAEEAPIYLQLDAFAPHFDNAGSETRPCRGRRAVPAPGDLEAFSDAPLPETSSFNERDLSDKPSFMRLLPRLNLSERRGLRRSWRCALASTLSVDRTVAGIAAELEALGELDQTMFIFTSDNGYAFGEHRVPRGKQLPYEELIRVPLLIRLPEDSGAQPEALDIPVANIDLAPTILDLAEARPCMGPSRCRSLDGRSLLEPIGGDIAEFADRSLGIEYGARGERSFSPTTPCAYRGLRAGSRVVIQHYLVPREGRGAQCRRARENEFYDLDTDPDQLDARREGKRWEQAMLRKARALFRCEGTVGPSAC